LYFVFFFEILLFFFLGLEFYSKPLCLHPCFRPPIFTCFVLLNLFHFVVLGIFFGIWVLISNLGKVIILFRRWWCWDNNNYETIDLDGVRLQFFFCMICWFHKCWKVGLGSYVFFVVVIIESPLVFILVIFNPFDLVILLRFCFCNSCSFIHNHTCSYMRNVSFMASGSKKPKSTSLFSSLTIYLNMLNCLCLQVQEISIFYILLWKWYSPNLKLCNLIIWYYFFYTSSDSKYWRCFLLFSWIIWIKICRLCTYMMSHIFSTIFL